MKCIDDCKKIYIMDDELRLKYWDKLGNPIVEHNKSDFKIFYANDIEGDSNLYYLYEYSDNIQLITDNPQYPSMLNYVKTGILTEEEMIQALLYK